MKPKELLYGINPILEIFRASPCSINKIILSPRKDRKSILELLEMTERYKVPVEYQLPHVLDRLAGTTCHQGVVALLSPRPAPGLEEIVDLWQRSGERLLVLVLDGIQDPQNLGALIRTALCCGAHGVVTAKDRAAQLTGTVFKASAGAAAHIPVAQVVNVVRSIQYFKKRGAWIIGADNEGETNLYEIDGTLDLVLVVGSEGRGLRSLVKKNCDFLVRIPLRGTISSLNVSTAGAVVLFEIVRQRHYRREKSG